MGKLSKIWNGIFRKQKFLVEKLSIEDIKGNELERILNGEISGVIVENFFESDNINAQNINYDCFSKTKVPFGFTTGLSIFNSKPDLSDYLEENKIYNQYLEKELIKINYRKTLEDIFSKVFYGKQTVVYSQNEKEFKISTLRIMEPGKEGIQEHIGNEFMFKFVQTESIRNETINITQFSFFLVLQSPSAGGELILYEKYWKNTPDKIVESGSLISKRKERTNFLNNTKKIALNLKQGDLLIFDGGRIWHEVSPVQGRENRITVGGFLAIRKDRQKIYYWS